MRLLRVAIPVLAIGVPLLGPAPGAGAASATCDGHLAKLRNTMVVRGGRGTDVLIGGPRSQTIFGGAGNDLICAGDGNDLVHGGAGNDTIRGEGRGDTLFGDRGGDRLYGDLLDDRLIGGPGADLLIGGHGVDKMFGGSGNDLLRGGVNRDCYDGGGGVNTTSFTTATPPGPSAGVDGVRVDLSRPAGAPGCRRGSGMAQGDGNDASDAEPLRDVQFVVGSAFSDQISGPGAGVDAGLGADACSRFPQAAGCAAGDEKPPGAFTYVFSPTTGAPSDPGLVVRAGDGVSGETVDLSGAGTGATVAVSGESLTSGPGCDAQGACRPASGALGYLVVYGGNGADTVNVGDGLPPDATIDVDGGPGNDTLNGSSLGEVLLAGDFPGADILNGNGGDDALVSRGGDAASGPDQLSGGGDDDQLVADYPCAGDTFSGGPGDDIAGFALSAVGIRATLDGIATLLNGTCPGGNPTRILPDSEVLEGSNKSDRLIGSHGPDTIWGRQGNDKIDGRAGADDLESFAGRDLIDARDGERDRRINCGSDRDRAARDRIDPRPISC
jgi:Ca2+-binding RTX toxin-like protein